VAGVTHVVKVLCYVHQDGRLLVFRQLGRPEQGIQVPGGSVGPGEALAQAALREAREETGLEHLRIARYLGRAEYELKVDAGPPHLRHFFELECAEATPERWRHAGSPPVEFELWWEPLPRVQLDWEQSVYVHLL
jgi:8-oxo-dGTP pyrophosphatase MutT (NUDIX family)